MNITKEQLDDEVAEMLAQAGIKADVVLWTRDEERKAKTRDHAYVDLDTRVIHFSRKTLDLDEAHRAGVIAHEVGHLLAQQHWGRSGEDDADLAADEFLGVRITYDHAWPGKGLQMQAKRNPTKPLDLELATSDEYGVHFETGAPVTFRYVRNTEKSPNLGAKYGQDIEPAGRYLLHNPDPGRLARGWEAGSLTFRNPLVIPLTGDRNAIYGPTGWKARLHTATGLTGQALSKRLVAIGYDGIVTVDPDGYTREIVDLTSFAGMKKNPVGYVHFSSRPEAPQVPLRAMNRFAGGTGPLGVYAYQLDAHAKTFAADRAYAFELTPTVPILYTDKYTQAELDRDLAKLATLVDISRPLRIWERFKPEIRENQLPFTKLWYVLARIPSRFADPDDPPPGGGPGAGFADPSSGRDLLVSLGHQIIDDRRGIMYTSEPEQAVFLTDTSFEATPMTRRNPAAAEDDIDRELQLEYDQWLKASEDKLDQIEQAFAKSPAIRGMFGKEPRMVIKSGELFDMKYGLLRVTFFGTDGPHGHATKRTDREVAEEVRQTLSPPYVPMTDDEVIAWTSTQEFEKGSKIIAFTQAENTLRYRAQQLDRYAWAQEVIQKANDAGTKDGAVNARGKPYDPDALDKALWILTAAITELPRQNPRVKALVRNPPWVTEALADSYKLIDNKVPPKWMPQLATVKTGPKDTIVASLLEYGCGAYGCVLATSDPGTVLKVTSDESEAEFAAGLSVDLVAPICVEYRMVVRLSGVHEGRQIHLLWRESAEHVGGIKKALGRSQGKIADDLIDAQHAAGQGAYHSIMTSDAAHSRKEITAWLNACEAMARGKVPELRPLGKGLIEVYERQRILFGDIHAGNLGLVKRPSGDAWVITDPGHVTVVDDD